MGSPASIRGRYDIRDVLGQGGMGVVYSAYDRVVKRLVAVKTIRDIPDPVALQLFQRESQVLADLSHPNIVEMFDVGEFSEDGFTKPYFVMPLLRGTTLDRLIMAEADSLSPARCVDIVTQACRGLAVAHESGLVHRDLKPSNLFVLEDDSVKIIDFGVAYLLSTGTTLGAKGTPYYMAPEQLDLGSASPLSDQFSLAVVAYQLLAHKLPFEGQSPREVARAVQDHVPAPIYDLNPAISRAVSQVVAKGLAKKPSHRFASVKEFSDSLQKAFHHSKPLAVFAEDRLLPRIERAERTLASGDLAFAAEIVSELEDEGWLHPAVNALRHKLDGEKKRAGVERLMVEAGRRYRECEYSLALEKVQEALRLDSDCVSAQTLKTEIENKRDEALIEEWFESAERSREKRDYGHAQENVERILRLRPANLRAQRLLSELKLDEADYQKECEERDRLYRSALEAWRAGDLTVALGRLERARQIDPANESHDLAESYRKLREEISQLSTAQNEIANHLKAGHASAALEACDGWLQKYPAQPVLQALRLSASEAKRQQIASYIAEVDQKAGAEKDLDLRLKLFEEAAAKFPDESHFQAAARAARERRDLVAHLLQKSRQFEKSGEWGEALEQWRQIGEIHPLHPELPDNKTRLQQRKQQQTEAEEKARWVKRIDRELEALRFEAAVDLIQQARERFAKDPEFKELERLAKSRSARRQLLDSLLDRGRALCAGDQSEEGRKLLRDLCAENPGDPGLKSRVVQIFTEEGRRLLAGDPEKAGRLVGDALAIDPHAAAAKELARKLAEHNREERIATLLAEARRRQAESDLPAALLAVEKGLAEFSGDPRLQQLRDSLLRQIKENRPIYEQEAERLENPANAPEASGRQERQERLQVLSAALGRAPRISSAPESPAPQEPRKRLSSEAAAPIVPDDEARPRPSEPSRASWFAKKANWPIAATAAAVLLIVLFLLVRHSPLKPTATKSAAAPIISTGSSTVPQAPAVTPATAPPPVAQPVTQPVTQSGPAIEVRADLPDSEVAIDGEPPRPLVDDTLNLTALAAGSHTLVIAAPDGRKASFRIDTSAAGQLAPPQVSARNLTALLGRVGDRQASLVSSDPRLAISLDQGRYQHLGSNPKLLSLDPGPHTANFASGTEHWTLPVESESTPKWVAVVHSSKGGSIIIATGVDGATISIDGFKLRRLSRNGALRIPNLPPRTYSITVSKDGFEDRSGQVTLGAGKRAILELPLSRKASPLAWVQIKGGPPGATVRLDGNLLGQIDPSGTMPPARVSSGPHQIQISKPKFETRSLSRQFESGETVQLNAAAVLLQPLPEDPATVLLDIAPPEADVALKRAGGTVPHLHNGVPYTIPAGIYTLAASAPGFLPQSQEVQLTSGERRRLAVHLVKQESAAELDLLSGWQNVAGWEREGNQAVHKGGGMVFYGRAPLSGQIRFSAELRKGKRLQWFVDYQNPAHYCRFEADRQFLYRLEMVGGHITETARKPYQGGDGKNFVVEISIASGSLIHKINGQLVDDWRDAKRDFSLGKFGFIVPGRSGLSLLGATELVLRSFSFTPA